MTPNSDTQVTAEAAELRRQARTLHDVARALESRADRLVAPAVTLSAPPCGNPACNLCRVYPGPALTPAEQELALNAGPAPVLYAGGRPL